MESRMGGSGSESVLKAALSLTAEQLTRGLQGGWQLAAAGDQPTVVRVGERIGGRYVVTRRLGEGGMGVVFAAEDVTSGETVALKLARADASAAPDLLRFRHEFYLMATLRHPSLVDVRRYFLTDDGVPVLVMEYVPGAPLNAIVPLPWGDALRVLYQVAAALAFLHSRRYVHHDIKPSNVLVERTDGRVSARLIDFGVMETSGGASRSGWIGTPAYMAPESLFLSSTDHRVDLYGLGVMAFEMLTGDLPFRTRDPQTFLAEKQVHPPDVVSLLGHVPVSLARLVADLMAPDAQERPYDASVVLRRLEELSPEAPPGDDVHEAPPYLSPSTLVEREDATRLARDAWRATTEHPVLLAIEGGVGMGRSALLREFGVRFQMRGAATASVASRDASGTFGLLRSVLRELAPFRQPEVFAAGDASVAAVIPELGAGASDAAAQAPEDSGRIFRALRKWLAPILADHVVAILVDDVEDADAASIDALAALVADAPPGRLVVVVTRCDGDTVSGPLRRLLAEARRVSLQRLSRQGIVALLGALFGSIEPHAELVRALDEATGGRPSLLVEVIRDLAAAGTFAFERGRWHLPRALETAPLPRSLSEVAERRLGALGPAARRVVDALAVAGGGASLELLPALLDMAEDDVFEGISELVRKGLVDGSDERFRLTASLPHRRVYESVPEGTRRALHLRLGLHLERLHEARSRRHAAQVADHFWRAGALGRARPHLEAATDELFSAHALMDARTPLERLEEVLLRSGAAEVPLRAPDGRALFEVRQRLARVGLAIDSALADRCFRAERLAVMPSIVALEGVDASPGRVGAARRLARLLGWASTEVARALAGEVGFGSLQQRLHQYFIATSYHSATLAMMGRFADSMAVADTIATFVTGERSRANWAYQVARAMVLVHQGRVCESERSIDLALELFHRPDFNEGVPEMDRNAGYSAMLTVASLMHASRGRSEARVWIRRFERFVTDHERSLTFLRPNLFLVRLAYHLHRGEILRAREVQREYRSHQARVGLYNASVEAQILVLLARVALAGRDYAQAEALHQELVSQPGAGELARGWGHCVRGEIAAAQRLHDRGRGALGRALRQASSPEEPSYKLRARALNALAALETDAGEYPAARGHALRALKLCEDVHTRNEYEAVWAMRALVQIEILADELEAAIERTGRLEVFAGVTDNPLFEAIAASTRADVSLAQGHKSDASAHQAVALRLLDAIGFSLTASPTNRSAPSTPSL